MAETHHIHGSKVKTRHPLAVPGLSIITLGIYSFVWYYKLNRELRDVGGSGSPGVSLLAVTLGGVILIPPFVSMYNTADRVRQVQERAGIQSPLSPVVALILLFVPIVNIFQMSYVQAGANRAWERLVPQGARAESSTEPRQETSDAQSEGGPIG